MRIRTASLQIALLILFLMLVGMSSVMIPYLASPNDRVFAGFHGYSADYIQYVSYIKEGMYGTYHMFFRSFPPAQPATPIHWEYTLFGIVGGALGLNAPVTYHLMRVIFGSLLIFATYKLFLALFLRHNLALISTFIAFTASAAGWLSHAGGTWHLQVANYFPFFVSTPQRVTDRPHYLLGSVLFLWILSTIMRKKLTSLTGVFLFLGSFVTVMVHVSSGIVLAALAIVLIGLSYILPPSERHEKKDTWLGASILFGAIVAALVTNHYVQIYSRISDIFIDKFTYAQTPDLLTIAKEFISFGPILWIGLPGLLLQKNKLMLAWGSIHIVLFFVLYPLFHVDQVRFVQSLYFIPLTYGTMWLLVTLSKRFGKMALYGGIGMLLIATLPTYVFYLVRDLGDMTDYRTFAPFGFPTKNQYAAYTYLDTHSPRESTVLAQYDCANMLLMYSHNTVIGNDQGWSPKDGQTMLAQTAAWFTGSSSAQTARAFLEKHHVSYIYYGYREKSLGDISHYPFLQTVYTNTEVTIYKVAY